MTRTEPTLAEPTTTERATAELPRTSGRLAPMRLLALAVAQLLALVVACSGGASAHGTHGSGPPVEFAVVVAVPVLAGLAGGLAATSRRVDAISVPHVGTAFGVALVALGFAFLFRAAADAPMLSVALAIGGGIAARTLLGHHAAHQEAGAAHRGADAALAAIGVHRFVEGSALAVAYGVGTAVGAFGAAVLAGHAVFEAAILGRLHVRIGRVRALAAVAAVQASFVLGAFVGGSAFPSSVRVSAAVLAVAGGVLLAVGLGETRWRRAVWRWQAVERLR